MRRLAWLGAAIVCLALAIVCAVQAFTGFEDEAPPSGSDPAFDDYERRRYAQARSSVVWGLLTSFLLLGAAACGQRAARGETGL